MVIFLVVDFRRERLKSRSLARLRAPAGDVCTPPNTLHAPQDSGR